MPILTTREAMKALRSGALLERTTDALASESDMRSSSAETGHELLEVDRDGAVDRFLLRKRR